MEVLDVTPSFWQGKRVLVTGHTGFKGSWLCSWLQRLGADLCGYSLPPPTDPAHLTLLGLDLRSEIGDIRDRDRLTALVADVRPEVVFHLAAQPLVRASYADPVETYTTNVIGTLHLFEACRAAGSVRAIVNVTSDKCYDNREWVWGYRETDPMGGYDPYSSSKGCAELLTASYRQSYFPLDRYGDTHRTLLASCRAGNVIGGGDWAADRLIPDLVRSVSQGAAVAIRNPVATRPWQHVLEPLSGYLLVAQRLLEGRTDCATGWNFGPHMGDVLSVRDVTETVKELWPAVQVSYGDSSDLHEAQCLTLDISQAVQKLHWQPRWTAHTCLTRTIQWYRAWHEDGTIRTADDLDAFLADQSQPPQTAPSA